MDQEFYYVYCEGILGVRTNIKDFKWIYGSEAPETCATEYKKCLIKFDVISKSDHSIIQNQNSYQKTFQTYFWDIHSKKLHFRRVFPLKFKMAYSIRTDMNYVSVEVGEHYYKFLKNRVMNLHGMYYLLSDLANILLLKNGYLTLYASAVSDASSKHGVVCFAPPNTGKTLLATTLCREKGYSLIGEDIVITDGNKIYSCPWTNTYNNRRDQENATVLVQRKELLSLAAKKDCPVTDLAVLSLGEEHVETDKTKIFNKVLLLNGYLFQHYSSPIVTILAYFDELFNCKWNQIANEMIGRLVEKFSCYEISAADSGSFFSIVDKLISEEDS